MKSVLEPKFCANVLYFFENAFCLSNKLVIPVSLRSLKPILNVILHYWRRALWQE